MARMITEEVPKGAEKVVFDAIQKIPNSKDWMVMHSVEVSERRGDPYPREVDFVICIPDCGIICLDAKGGVYRIDEKTKQWTNTNKKKRKSIESPWRQSRQAMFAFKNMVAREYPNDAALKSVPIMPAVAFTRADWPKGEKKPQGGRQFFNGTEVQDPDLFAGKLENLAKILQRRDGPKPSTQMLGKLEALFFPNAHMESVWTSGLELNRIVRELGTLTEVQSRNLRLAQNEDGEIVNPRVLFTGAAGTGKTILAMKLARLRHEAGDRVGFLCHTYMLGDWVSKQLSPDIVAVGTVGGMLGLAAGASPEVLANLTERLSEAYIEGSSSDELWEMIESQCLDWAGQLERDGRKFDYLIVDELQYFRDPRILQVLDLALEGGIKNGRWAMFGDFVFQDVLGAQARLVRSARGSGHSPRGEDPREQLADLCQGDGLAGAWVNAIPLEENCRNTRLIGNAITRMLGSDPAKIHPSRVEGPPVDYRWFQGETGDGKLIEVFEQLQEHGIAPERVAVVYTHQPHFPEKHDQRVGPWRLWDPFNPQARRRAPIDNRTVEICESFMFAGMERDVVVVACTHRSDGEPGSIESPSEKERFLQEMYTCMTRAKGGLVVIAHESMKGWIRPNSSKAQ